MIFTYITTHHIILSTTKFDVTNETNPTKEKGVFVFNIKPFCESYPNIHSPCEAVMAQVKQCIDYIKQITTITFICDQAINIDGVIYVNLTACIGQHAAGEVVTFNATSEHQHSALTTKSRAILTEYFTETLVNIYKQYLDNIKQAAVITYLQNFVEKMPQYYSLQKMRLMESLNAITASLAEKVQKKGILMHNPSKWIKQWSIASE